MLNELYSLSAALSSTGIHPDVWHREYEQLPNANSKSPCYKILISEKGFIKSIDGLTPEIVQKLRKFGNNNGTFPAFNIKPLYRMTDNAQKKELAEVMKGNSELQQGVVQAWIANANDNWQKGLKNIDSSISRASSRLLETIVQFNGDGVQIVAKLIEAVNALNGGLRVAIEIYLLSALEETKNTKLLGLLFHSGEAKKIHANDMGRSISVILDLAEWENYGYPVASEKTTKSINSALLHADEAKSTGINTNLRDAFGSPYDPRVSEPMPSVKIPGFDVTLRSMYEKQLCQKRYGKVSDGSFPIAKVNRIAAKGALEQIVSPKQEGITWQRADGGKEVVLVYPSKFIETPVPYASWFGKMSNHGEERAQARFEDCSKDFSRVFSGLAPEKQPKYIRVFSIKKMDEARRKVVLTRNCSPQWFLGAAKSWQLGCANIPAIDGTELTIPFPLDVATIANTVWQRSGKTGSSSKTIKRVHYYQGIELLLDSLSNEQVLYYLRIILRNYENLVVLVGNDRRDGTYVSQGHSMDIANFVALLGLLLFKGGYKKEDYMQSVAYLVGQILKASDELHANYCKVERQTDKIPQLVGNSMLITASETPGRALAQLNLRMAHYLSWAKRYGMEKDQVNGVPNKLVLWYLGVLGDLSKRLAMVFSEPMRFGDFEKAQLFLGYLASFQKNDDANNRTASNTDNKKMEEGDFNAK